MFRSKYAAICVVVAVVLTASGMVHADVVHLNTGQSLTDVQVVSKNWRGYEIQLTPDVTVFFSRDEIVDVERDNIEPGRELRGRKPGSADSGESVTRPFHGDEVSPELSARLQELVNVHFDKVDLRDITKKLSEVYGVDVQLDPRLFEPGGLDDSTWSVNSENEQFINVIKQLVLDKGLTYTIRGDTIVLSKAGSPATNDQ